MELNAKTFKNVKIGTILVKDPCYETSTEFTVTKISSKFLCYKFHTDAPFNGKTEHNGRVSMKYFDGKDGKNWVTGWHIKDEEWQKKWDKYFEGCGTEQWYYAHGGN